MLTRQQQELLNLLNEADASGDFELTIKSKGGQWHLSFVAPRQAKRGMGETFAESWEDAKLEPNGLHIADIAEWARAKTGLPSTVSSPPRSSLLVLLIDQHQHGIFQRGVDARPGALMPNSQSSLHEF